MRQKRTKVSRGLTKGGEKASLPKKIKRRKRRDGVANNRKTGLAYRCRRRNEDKHTRKCVLPKEVKREKKEKERDQKPNEG